MKLKILFLFGLFTQILFGQTNSEIQKLQDFAKIYGVVRYFHPSDESAKLNWDLFTVYGVEEVLKTKNQQEFESKIKELFLPIAPSITFDNSRFIWDKKDSKPLYWENLGLASGSKSELYKRRRNGENKIILKLTEIPAPNDFYTVQLSNNFRVTIPLIVYEKNGQTFPTGNIEKYADLKEKSYDQNVAISNIIIMWSGLRHFYPYQDELKIEWDNILDETLKNAFNNKTPEDNFFTLRKFSHYFKDGHMSINYPNYYKFNSYYPPIKLKYLHKSNQLVVSDLMMNINDLQKGDVISSIDWKSTNELFDDLKKNLSGSEQFVSSLLLREILKGQEGSKITLQLENKKNVTLDRNYRANQNLDFFNKINTVEMKELEVNILYINLQNFTEETAKKNLNYIQNFSKIILDIRGYPRRGNGWKVFSMAFFSNRNKLKFLVTPKIQNPFFENVNYSDYIGWDLKKDKELNAQMVLLANEGSVSFQESITQFLKDNDYVTFMGRPTAGANGERNDISLLSGMGYSFTGRKVKNSDGSNFHTKGVQPDIIIEENLEDIKNGKDTFIEKAIEYLNKKAN